jgi:hypothetical protein
MPKAGIPGRHQPLSEAAGARLRLDRSRRRRTHRLPNGPQTNRMLRPPPFWRAVRHAGVRGAVGKSTGGFVPAKNEIGGAAVVLAERPAALAVAELEQRTALRPVDCRRCADCGIGDRRRSGADQPQHLPLRRNPRVLGAGRAHPPQRSRGSPRSQTEAMNLADNRVAADADLGGNLAAGQAGADKCAELRNPLRIPGVSGRGRWVGQGNIRLACNCRGSVLDRRGECPRNPGVGAPSFPAPRWREHACGRLRQAAGRREAVVSLTFSPRTPLPGSLLSLLRENRRRDPNWHDSIRLPRVLTV